LAKNHSVVFVSINYRRGVLGFLSLDALSKRAYPSTSGNYGLGDIVSALQWIKLNINHFGGHPSKVTLLGRGSGATLVTALTATAKTRDLIKRVWVSNGAGIFEDKSLDQANKENQVKHLRK
jgi:carboxylesterase type B